MQIILCILQIQLKSVQIKVCNTVKHKLFTAFKTDSNHFFVENY